MPHEKKTMSLNAGAAVLMATHGFLIPGIWYTATRWIVLAFSHFILTAIASTYYHGCRAYGICLGPPDTSYTMAVKTDYFFALGNIPIIAFAIITNLNLLTLATNKTSTRLSQGFALKELFSIISLFQVCQAVILITVLVTDVQTSLIPAIVTVLVTTLTIWLHMSFTTGGRLGFYSKFNFRLLLVALVFTFVSLYFFYDESEYYSWYHSFWHIFSFLGTTFIVIAASTPRRVNLGREVKEMYKVLKEKERGQEDAYASDGSEPDEMEGKARMRNKKA